MAIQFSRGKNWDFSFPCLEFCHCVKVFLIFNMHSSYVVPKAVSALPKYNLLRFWPGLGDYIEKKQSPSVEHWEPRGQKFKTCKAAASSVAFKGRLVRKNVLHHHPLSDICVISEINTCRAGQLFAQLGHGMTQVRRQRKVKTWSRGQGAACPSFRRAPSPGAAACKIPANYRFLCAAYLTTR